MPDFNIKTVDGRAKLAPRRDPYFVPIRMGCALGFRKMTATSVGSWVARYIPPGTTKKVHEPLGEFSDLPPSRRYDAALDAAEKWFSRATVVGSKAISEVRTVREACEAYVKHIADGDGKQTPEEAKAKADEIAARFERWVYPHHIASVRLEALTMGAVEKWRKFLAATPVVVNPYADEQDRRTRPRSPSTLNRDMTALRAALNYAHTRGHIDTAVAWLSALQPIKNADTARDVYLTREERRKLIDSTTEADNARAFVEGLCLLPFRPGALAALRVSAFDSRLGVLTVGKDKAGRDRKISLPQATAERFKALCKDKTPAAFIFARANGSAWNKDAWKGPIKDAVTAAKVNPKATAYALRHSTITDLVPVLDLLTVAQLSGTSVAMIEKHYGHLKQTRAADALAMLAV